MYTHKQTHINLVVFSRSNFVRIFFFFGVFLSRMNEKNIVIIENRPLKKSRKKKYATWENCNFRSNVQFSWCVLYFYLKRCCCCLFLYIHQHTHREDNQTYIHTQRHGLKKIELDAQWIIRKTWNVSIFPLRVFFFFWFRSP